MAKILNRLMTARVAICHLVLTLFLFTSCEMEVSHNGDLDGLWQLTEIREVCSPIIDIRETGTTWGFQFNLVEIHCNARPSDVIARFERSGDYLRIYSLRYQHHDLDDQLITDPTYLVKYGIFSLDETFKIEALTGNSMCLSSPHARLVFRKY